MFNSTFDGVTLALRPLVLELNAAEAHGCLCGALCAIRDLTLSDWLDELVRVDGDSDDSNAPDPLAIQGMTVPSALRELFENTRSALHQDAMGLVVLLPSDDQPLRERVAALSQWVSGFLYGFGVGAVRMASIPTTVTEALADFANIARADPEEVEETEEDETAYAELVEYLRAATQVVFDELATLRAVQAPPPTAVN